MNPLLIEALVSPHIDDLRRSARTARPSRTAPAPRPTEPRR
jgi:hypothetical protein